MISEQSAELSQLRIRVSQLGKVVIWGRKLPYLVFVFRRGLGRCNSVERGAESELCSELCRGKTHRTRDGDTETKTERHRDTHRYRDNKQTSYLALQRDRDLNRDRHSDTQRDPTDKLCYLLGNFKTSGPRDIVQIQSDSIRVRSERTSRRTTKGEDTQKTRDCIVQE